MTTPTEAPASDPRPARLGLDAAAAAPASAAAVAATGTLDDVAALAGRARAVRRTLLGMHYAAGSGHIGTGLSAVDLLLYAFVRVLTPADRFILSKGHGAAALYATLHHVGALSSEMLATYYQDGTLLPAHPAPRAHPQIPIATGSLGHGLPVATGLAYAWQHLPSAAAGGRAICLLSDGECNEGTTWEAALFASHHRLHNLTVVVDANGLQGFGRTRDVLDLEPFAAKWRAFGFAVHEIDGHDLSAMPAAFKPDAARPTCVLARTVKGKGVAFMEDELSWHYLPLTEPQYRAALAGLADAQGAGTDEA